MKKCVNPQCISMIITRILVQTDVTFHTSEAIKQNIFELIKKLINHIMQLNQNSIQNMYDFILPHLTAPNGSAKAVGLLLKAGTNKYVQDKDGITLLDIATYHDTVDVMGILLKVEHEEKNYFGIVYP